MSEAGNTQAVKDAYAAFQRGDINAILALLDEQVEWEGVKGSEGVAPQAGVKRGRAAVAEFFSIVGSTLEFHEFAPKEFVAQGEQVAAIGSYKATVKATRRSVAADWVMVFTFRAGKVIRFREFSDSAAVNRAYAGSAVMA
jgi:ketosteroid isomerase-like protein